MKQATNNVLANVIDKEGEFNFYPYVYTPSCVSHSHSRVNAIEIFNGIT